MMFNSNLTVNKIDKSVSTLKISASGMLQKSNSESIFLRFHPTSNQGQTILSLDPHIVEKKPENYTDRDGRMTVYQREEKKKVQVLQILLDSEGFYLTELIVAQSK